MEIESTNHQDVAEPDLTASGVAGTGHEYRNKNGITGKHDGNSSQRKLKNSNEFLSSSRLTGTFQTGKRNREIIGFGVLFNETTSPAKIPDNANSPATDSSSDTLESAGDLIFYLYERQERIADRLNKKIKRLDRRLTKFEERRRS
jgi:hypothetical protein